MKKFYDEDEKRKRFYTVKEAARILGLSTNTVYKYLEEGSLKGKRFEDRGRFKIPFSELAPYLAGEDSIKTTQDAQDGQKAGGRLGIFELVLGIFLGLIFFNFFSQRPLMADIATAVWNYPGRTFSGFESLVRLGTPRLAALTSKFMSPKTPPDTTEESPKEEVNEEKLVLIKVPEGSSVNVRGEATLSAKIIAKIETSNTASKLGEEGDWTKVAIADFPVGWVNNRFIGTEDEATSLVLGSSREFEGQRVVINETPTGFLRVRAAPWGDEIGKVYPGETYVLLDKSDDWFLIEIAVSQKGWISSQFATIQSAE